MLEEAPNNLPTCGRGYKVMACDGSGVFRAVLGKGLTSLPSGKGLVLVLVVLG